MTDKPNNDADLWPDDILQIPKTKAPVAILKEQAAILGQKTNNSIKGSIEQNSLGPKNRFDYIFIIIATGINYNFRLFEIYHDINFYPITIKINEDTGKELANAGMKITNLGTVKVSSEKEFLEALRIIFNSPTTRNVLSSLLSLSGYKEDDTPIPF
jgi:hypothetical protein